MVNVSPDYKVKLIIDTFLTCNKGKRYRASQIAQFITENNFMDKRSGISYMKVSSVIRKAQRGTGKIGKNIMTEERNGRTYYYKD